jgi:hypothetical protein
MSLIVLGLRTIANQTAKEAEGKESHENRGAGLRPSALIVYLNQRQASGCSNHSLYVNDGEHASDREREGSGQAHEERVHDDFRDILARIRNLLAEVSTCVTTKKCVDGIANAEYKCKPIAGPARGVCRVAEDPGMLVARQGLKNKCRDN